MKNPVSKLVFNKWVNLYGYAEGSPQQAKAAAASRPHGEGRGTRSGLFGSGSGSGSTGETRAEARVETPTGGEETPSRSADAGEADSSGVLVIDRHCAECGIQSANCKMCSGCKCVWYCSGACQKFAWKAHRVACKAAKTSKR
jgi:hypothetical protein